MKALLTAATAGLLASAAQAQDARLAAPAGARDYDYQLQAVYPLVAMPGRITDIVLEPGEVLTGPIAAGDTARWIVADTASGAGASRQVHVLVKPTSTPLATNLLIMSDRRTYHLELRASGRTWFSRVAWRYPNPPVVPAVPATTRAPEASPPDPAASVYAYRLDGDRVAWRPARVFDDGRRTFIQFAETAELAVLPPLYLVGDDGKTGVLIDYHVQGRTLVLDRLLDRAQLRLGRGRKARAVSISRIEKGDGQ